MNRRFDVFFLGAGRPATGSRPSALRDLGANSRALDWQLQSLARLDEPRIHFLGGYHVEEVIRQFPELLYTVVPNWEQQSILHTFLAAPVSIERPAFFCYSDTVFRRRIIDQVARTDADVVVVYDSQWQRRYADRDPDDLAQAEKFHLSKFGPDFTEVSPDADAVEFTGLLKLGPRAIEYVLELADESPGGSVMDLLRRMASTSLSFASIDADGHWAEFNSSRDIAHFVLGTKAETLRRIAPLLKSGTVGGQVTFSVGEWNDSRQAVLEKVQGSFSGTRLIVRSSSSAEDGWDQSNAGGFDSILDVDSDSAESLQSAIETVIASYQRSVTSETHEVLVQEFVSDVRCSGVIFARSLETGAPYYRINFDDTSSSTDTVTSGSSGFQRTVIVARDHIELAADLCPYLVPVLEAVQELESILAYDRLDIEFAVDSAGVVHIFQVRPIAVDHSDFELEDARFSDAIADSVRHFERLQQPTPFVVGASTAFGVMPDWNPAEIIGTRPKPLALSLYRHLITDEVWAAQRAEFGYRDVRPHPLIVSFAGQPYIDIRASLNSFTPRSVSESTATTLVDAYLSVLDQNPHFHDKLEFEVAFTVLSPTFDADVASRLVPHGVTSDQIEELREGLRRITQSAFGRLEADLEPIERLSHRRDLICEGQLDPLDKAVALIEDCRRFGTLAFSHAARAGFVAAIFLKGLVGRGAISEAERQKFLGGVKTVAGEFEDDARRVAAGDLSKSDFVRLYGHLRPGTYDLTVPAYWEAPEKYLFPKVLAADSHAPHDVEWTGVEAPEQVNRVFRELGLDLDVDQFFLYARRATEGREAAKFEFTRNLSRALDFVCEFGAEIGVDREALAFLRYEDLTALKTGALAVGSIREVIAQRRQDAAIARLAELPQLLFSAQDFFCFERAEAQPNFVTSESIEAGVVTGAAGVDHPQLEGRIVLIEQADPGCDWLFAHGIAGLITKYGGANSHMAIRAAELNLPAAIGVGDLLYEKLVGASMIRLDCDNCRIRRID